MWVPNYYNPPPPSPFELFTYFWKNLTLAITFEPRDRTFIYQVCIPSGKTFLCTKTFDPVTLTFDLLLKKLNLCHNFWTKHITHVYSSWQDLSVVTNIFQLMTLTLAFDLILRNWKCLITIIASQVYKCLGQGLLVPLGQPCSSLSVHPWTSC